jgi:hypothetical protein
MKALLLDYLNNSKMMFPIEYKLQNKHTYKAQNPKLHGFQTKGPACSP